VESPKKIAAETGQREIKKLTDQLTGGKEVISVKGGIPKIWEKPFCFYY
jgi:hypothetical protein